MNTFYTPMNHKGATDLWATAASADLLHASFVAGGSTMAIGDINLWAVPDHGHAYAPWAFFTNMAIFIKISILVKIAILVKMDILLKRGNIDDDGWP